MCIDPALIMTQTDLNNCSLEGIVYHVPSNCYALLFYMLMSFCFNHICAFGHTFNHTGFWDLLGHLEAADTLTLLLNVSPSPSVMTKGKDESCLWRAVGISEDQVFTLTHTYIKSLYFSPCPSLCLSSREPSRPTSLLPADWSSGLGLGREEELLPPGLETLPLRLMQQDCTAVKTLLLRLRRTLQEVGFARAHTDQSIYSETDYIPAHFYYYY